MRIKEITLERVRQAYRNQNLRPNRGITNARDPAGCCALAAVAADVNGGPTWDWSNLLVIPNHTLNRFGMGFDRGFCDEMGKMDYRQEERGEWQQGYDIGRAIAKDGV